MMPVIRIPDPIFERLQAIATPLVDTPASVIEKLLDFYDGKKSASVPERLRRRRESLPRPADADPDAPPELAHTRVVSATFAGHTASNWNELVYLANHKYWLNWVPTKVCVQ